jgi:HSP20 family protein
MPITPKANTPAPTTLRKFNNFKSLENKNAAPNFSGMVPHGAAPRNVSQESLMFVLPITRPAARAAAPQFSRVIDRLLDESLAHDKVRTPALDVSETDAGYTVAFEVPGVSREQLKVSVEGRRLTLETLDVTPAADDAGNGQPKVELPRVLYRERSTGRYARTVSLPAEVDQAASTAKFENGVLTLTLAKKVPSGATQIRIG